MADHGQGEPARGGRGTSVRCATAGPIRFRDLITQPDRAVRAVRWEIAEAIIRAGAAVG